MKQIIATGGGGFLMDDNPLLENFGPRSTGPKHWRSERNAGT